VGVSRGVLSRKWDKEILGWGSFLKPPYQISETGGIHTIVEVLFKTGILTVFNYIMGEVIIA